MVEYSSRIPSRIFTHFTTPRSVRPRLQVRRKPDEIDKCFIFLQTTFGAALLARDAAAHNRAVRTGDLVQLYTTPSHQPEHIMCHSHNGDLYSVYTSALLWLTSYLYITLRKWFILKGLTFLSIGYVKDF